MHPFDWKIEDSEHVVQDEWISVRADKCRMPDGRIVEPYYVLEYPNWVNILALTPSDEAVMVRQYRHGVGQTILELPCGRMDETDASPLETAQRELREETGYSGDNFKSSGEMFANAASHSNRLYTFIAQGVTLSHEQELDYSEEIEVVLVPIKELVDMLDSDSMFPSTLHTTIYNGLRKLGKLTFNH